MIAKLGLDTAGNEPFKIWQHLGKSIAIPNISKLNEHRHTANHGEPLEISLLYANQTPDDILMKDELDAFTNKGMKAHSQTDFMHLCSICSGFFEKSHSQKATLYRNLRN